ncbi:translation initiation factor 2 [Asanoa ferruginea]|uniref:translation initiation factor 2 n=1 Tax=Asanoa ferruginea TaxID=53367 RepID=UPI000E22FE6D|nr:translation initiation factor 2 [Asanoa ferruginea]
MTYDDPNLDPWRRPGPGAEPVPGRPGQPPAVPPTGYSGPPSTDPPPAGWRPPTYVQPPPPRQLAPQDLDKVEAQEKDARTLTYGVALVAAAVMVVLSCLLCSRVLF